MIEYDYDDDAYGGGGFGAVPASGEAIEALARAAVGETREAECAICVERFEEGHDAIRKMPCSHGFHEGCISRWLRVSRVCPCCRLALPADDDKWAASKAEFGRSATATEHGYADQLGFDEAYAADIARDDDEDDDEEGEEEEEKEEGCIYLMVDI